MAYALENLYKIIGSLTPLPVDCGQLCQAKCCQEWQEGVGVYLVPGERELLAGQDWARIQETEQAEGLLLCTGSCKRSQRPLLCRLFPLAARFNIKDELEVVLDEDGLLICPLVQAGDLSLLNPQFIQAVKRVWQELSQTAWGKHYLESYSQRLEQQKNDSWKKLFK